MDAHRDEPATKGDLDLVRKDLDQVKQELTDKIDANGKKIDRVEQRLTDRLDKLTVYAIENREQLSKTLTREEYKKDYNELLRGQDEMMVILTRLDEERVATASWIRRVEGGVDTNKSDIRRIKTKLAMDT